MSADLRFDTTLHEDPDIVIQLQGLLSRQKKHRLIRLSKPSPNLGVLPDCENCGGRHNKSHNSNCDLARGEAGSILNRSRICVSPPLPSLGIEVAAEPRSREQGEIMNWIEW